EIDLDAVHGELAVDVNRASERPERAHLDLSACDAWNVGSMRTAHGNGGCDRYGRKNSMSTSFHLKPPGCVGKRSVEHSRRAAMLSSRQTLEGGSVWKARSNCLTASRSPISQPAGNPNSCPPQAGESVVRLFGRLIAALSRQPLEPLER